LGNGLWDEMEVSNVANVLSLRFAVSFSFGVWLKFANLLILQVWDEVGIEMGVGKNNAIKRPRDAQ